MDIIVTFSAGTYELVLRELKREHGFRGSQLLSDSYGRLLLRNISSEEMGRLALWLRSASRVYLLLRSFSWRDDLRRYLEEPSLPTPDELKRVNKMFLEHIYQQLYEAAREYNHLFIRDYTLAVRSKRLMNIPTNQLLHHRLPDRYEELRLLKNRDIERVAGQAIIDAILELRGYRLKVNLEEPDLLVRVELLPWGGYIALDLTGVESMVNRGYRIYKHPAAMKGHLAFCAITYVYQLRFSEEIIFHDPMCGGGTIPIELIWWHMKVPPTIFKWRKLLLWKLLKLIDRDTERKLIDEMEASERSNPSPRPFNLHVFCSDVSRKHISGAEENIQIALRGHIPSSLSLKLMVEDVINLSAPSPHLVVTNPPYGIRYGSPRSSERAYRALFKRYSELLRDDGILVLFTPREKLVEEIAQAHGFRRLSAHRTLHGDLPVSIIAFQRA